MIAGTLSRYFGWRFLSAVLAVFAGTLVLTAMIDFLELMRRSADIKDVSAFVIAQITLFRVPFITERVMPFAVLVGAMFCYLNLSRRLELAVARAAGVSAWQFISPAIIIAALIGVALTTIYNPISANLRELSTRLEADLSGRDKGFRNSGSGFWVGQRNDDGLEGTDEDEEVALLRAARGAVVHPVGLARGLAVISPPVVGGLQTNSVGQGRRHG